MDWTNVRIMEPTLEDIREGETVGDYVSRLERRVKELEPAEGFTIQEWHIGQVYSYLLWKNKDDLAADSPQQWSDRLTMFEERFPEATKKFADYMDWGKRKQEG
jgi:hypothetical protein